MQFNSYQFILVFLPLSVLIYNCARRSNGSFKKIRKYLLILLSTLFYLSFSRQSYFILITSIILNFCVAKLIVKNKSKRLMLFGVFMNVLFLSTFKFSAQILPLLAKFSFIELPQSLIFPIGISFYTFQQISYLVDVYSSENNIKYSFIDYVTYMTFFPSILSGPITYHHEFIPQLNTDKPVEKISDDIALGMQLFVIGLAKKVIIADRLLSVVDTAYANLDNTTTILFAIVGFSLQLYFDFSGYSDMARGISRMLGFNIPKNFNSPYKALSLADFWKRWHITLTRFFTKYIYIPLGGNRKGKLKEYLFVMIVFAVSGIWHGTGITFLVWGIIHGLGSIVSKRFSETTKTYNPAFRWVMTFTFVSLAWVYFRSPDIQTANGIMRGLLLFNFGPINPKVLGSLFLPEATLVDSLFGLQLVTKHQTFTMTIFFIVTMIIVMNASNSDERNDKTKLTTYDAIKTAFLLIWSLSMITGVSTFLYTNF